MRILNVIGSLDPTHGGPIEGTLRLTELWRASGHQVECATLDPEDAPFLPRDGSVHALGTQPRRARTPAGRFLGRFAFSPHLVPWLRQNASRFDAVIVHALWNYSTMAARRALVGGTVPWFVFPHGALDPWFARTYPFKTVAKRLLWPFNEGPLVNGAAGVLFTTQEEARLAAGSFHPWRPRPRIVGFGCADAPEDTPASRAAFRAACPALKDRRFLLFLSRIHPKKGCDLLIEAFAKVARATDLDLVIAGPDQLGWRAKLEARAVALGLGNRIHWPGMIAGDVKWGAYREADAFILPSHSENFGVVVAEALAAECPVLITDKVNLWREVAGCGAGLVEDDTTAGVTRLISRFLALPDSERREMRIAARTCYEANFRFEVAAQRMIELFEEARK